MKVFAAEVYRIKYHFSGTKWRGVVSYLPTTTESESRILRLDIIYVIVSSYKLSSIYIIWVMI